jgi:hypothetical protein
MIFVNTFEGGKPEERYEAECDTVQQPAVIGLAACIVGFFA